MTKNENYLKKVDPERKNIDFDPLTKSLPRFKGKFYGGTDRPAL